MLTFSESKNSYFLFMPGAEVKSIGGLKQATGL